MRLQGLSEIAEGLLHDTLVACREALGHMAVRCQTRVQMRRDALRVNGRALSADTEVLGTFHNRFLEFVPLALLGHHWRARVAQSRIVLSHL